MTKTDRNMVRVWEKRLISEFHVSPDGEHSLLQVAFGDIGLALDSVGGPLPSVAEYVIETPGIPLSVTVTTKPEFSAVMSSPQTVNP